MYRLKARVNSSGEYFLDTFAFEAFARSVPFCGPLRFGVPLRVGVAAGAAAD